MDTPIFSAQDTYTHTSADGLRTFSIAALTFRERQAYRADLSRDAGIYPSNPQLLAALREAVHEISPGNADELIAAIDAAEAAPEDAAAMARLVAIESACAAVPVYSALVSARTYYMGMMPFIAARHALRGWEGPGLPEFQRARGVVPEALIEHVSEADITACGWRAVTMMAPNTSAEGNSASASPSPASPTPAEGASSQKMGGAGGSRGKSGKATRA